MVEDTDSRLIPEDARRNHPLNTRLCILLCLPLLGGCSGIYFRDAGAPPIPPPQHALADLPYDEYWTGLIFNGNKIGFTNLSISPVSERQDMYELHARAVMHIRFLTIDKKVRLESTDVVHLDVQNVLPTRFQCRHLVRKLHF